MGEIADEAENIALVEQSQREEEIKITIPYPNEYRLDCPHCDRIITYVDDLSDIEFDMVTTCYHCKQKYKAVKK